MLKESKSERREVFEFGPGKAGESFGYERIKRKILF